jgi:hypothetical protein
MPRVALSELAISLILSKAMLLAADKKSPTQPSYVRSDKFLAPSPAIKPRQPP